MDIQELLARHQIAVFPLFGDLLQGAPYHFDFSPGSEVASPYTTTDFQRFQHEIFDELAQSGKQWGMGPYLENRSPVLARFPQMIEEGRVFHAGLDIVVPEGAVLFAPLAGTVAFSGLETGSGNYGGYVCLKHQLGETAFYSFYGHLNSNHTVKVGDQVNAGEEIGRIGAGEDSGGWFTHVHLQLLTPKAMEAGLLLKGYVTLAQLDTLQDFFPNPNALFRA